MLVCVVAACVGGGYALARQSAYFRPKSSRDYSGSSSYLRPFLSTSIDALSNHDYASCHNNLPATRNSLQGGFRCNYLPLTLLPWITSADIPHLVYLLQLRMLPNSLRKVVTGGSSSTH
jgi:hypothetical protein